MPPSHHFSGLSDQEVLANRKRYGRNILTPPKKTPLWKQFLVKFEDPLIVILLVAGLLSVGISFYEYFCLDHGHGPSVFFEPLGIFMAIALATGLAFIFELQADKEFSLLNQVNDDEPVRVIRNGSITEVPKKDIVVGDIIMIETGEEIPADAELLEAVALHIDESTLTGEPMCAKTTHENDFDPEAPFPSNHVMRGSKVMEGYGICRVFAVGDQTENGKIFEAAQLDDSVRTPLNEQLDALGKFITKAGYTVAGLIVIARPIVYLIQVEPFNLVDFISHFLQTIMIAVTLIVVAVPEGLPMAVTLSLAYSMKRMFKTNNLIRKMHACETMGATTVICTDKTGTLTQNQMRVHQSSFPNLTEPTSEQQEQVKLITEGISVNSTAQLDLSNPKKPIVLGNPTEGALILWLHDQGIDYRDLKERAKVLESIPFSTERKFMATVVQSATGENILYVKGAPERILALCGDTISEAEKASIQKQLLINQKQAMRTLAFAYAFTDDSHPGIVDGNIVSRPLHYLGFVAIADPVRPDVPEAIKECREAGIDIKIVTGDTNETAKEIGRQIGLWSDEDGENAIITGAEFAALSDAEAQERVRYLKIIARARPLDKKRLVELLQADHQVVAVTGDGTNDAPALKAAHVGLSMGDGTSVAKEASDITIIDNSFASITRAVMWGRSLYRNIQKFILFQLTVNVVACLIVLLGAFIGTESPLTVTQMLWINLIMDTFAAMALASLPPSHDVMKDKPRDRRAFIISPSMKKNILIAGLSFFFFLWGLLYIFQHAQIEHMSDLLDFTFTENHNLSGNELSLFFTTFVALQIWNLLNVRAFMTKTSAFQLKGCQGFLLIFLIILIGQILIVSFGGDFFSVKRISLSDWLIIFGVTSIVLWIGEIIRWFERHQTQIHPIPTHE